MANVLLAGRVLTGAGVAVVGATVEVFDRDTVTPARATFTGGTDASGDWSFSYAPGANSRRVDVRVTNGTSVSFLKFNDQIQLSSIETANLRIINPAFTFEYNIVPAAITAARQMNLPLLTADDTIVVLAEAQTLTNKTLTSPVINTQLTGTAVGTGASQVATGNHTHATAVTRAGGNTIEATTTSTTVVDLLTTTVSIATGGIPVRVVCMARKTAGAANSASIGLKVNTTSLVTAGVFTDTVNTARSGGARAELQTFQTNHDQSVLLTRFSPGFTTTLTSGNDAVLPNATLTSIIILGLVADALITLAADEKHVYTFAVN